MSFKINGLSVNMAPSITKWSFEDLGDDPEKHRWRAWWASGDRLNEVSGIELRAYPVIKQTKCGVWIDTLAWREWSRGENDPYQIWNLSALGNKFIHNDSGQAWAKPTQDQAIKSLAIRLCRWSNRVAGDIRRIESASNALAKLRPDIEYLADQSRQNLTARP